VRRRNSNTVPAGTSAAAGTARPSALAAAKAQAKNFICLSNTLNSSRSWQSDATLR